MLERLKYEVSIPKEALGATQQVLLPACVLQGKDPFLKLKHGRTGELAF